MSLRPVLALLLAATAVPVSATTLQEALAQAYKTNPTINAARAGQRANDENDPILRSRGLPNLAGSSNFNQTVINGQAQQQQQQGFLGPTQVLQSGVNLNVPIYQGGQIRNGLRAADLRIQAGQSNLRDTEQSLFSQVVGAYMDVIRDGSIVSLNQANVRALQVNLEATRDRFQVGDLTRTDVAQSESRLALAQGQLEQAQSQLINSREQYIRLVGVPAVDLQPPPPLPKLPGDPQSAVQLALDANPGLAAARGNRDASRYDVRAARAAFLPRVSVTGGYNNTNYLGSLTTSIPGVRLQQSQTGASVGVGLTLPLFQGGLPGAQVRQAQAREQQAIEQQTETERAVVAQVRAALAAYRASNEQIRSNQVAVDSARLSLEGVRAENTVGQRTILDILNAEQELLNAQVNLVSAQRNAYVAGFSLLASTGQAGARDLGLGVDLYDPTTNARAARRTIFDFRTGPTPTPIATRTVDTPAQTAVVPPAPQQ